MIGRLALLLTMGLAAPAAAQTAPALLPQPAVETAGQGAFPLPKVLTVAIPLHDAGARAAVERLSELTAKTRLGTVGVANGGAIRFVRTQGLGPEAYRLIVMPDGITVAATGDAGLFYGAVSLWQLLTEAQARAIPAVTIEDAPRFAWRGMMLDSARHFQSPAFVMRLIDAMAANKLNVLHWHLVDDQGWRLPVPKYPKLTSISAWRRGAIAPGAPPLPVEGGFYTAAQIRQIVAYAAARHITVVPEIEMPGHALAAIRAYPRLGMGVPVPPGTESDYGVFPWLYNADDSTFRFIEDVLDETMKLFPSRYIHVGGDEATKEQWNASPAIQAKMKSLGITSEDKLQGWFVARIGQYLAAHGRKLIGWDEILEGDVPADATVMSWRGVDGAVAAAKAGHDTVLSPAPVLYFDNRQGVDAAEGPGRGALIALADVYAFDPAPASIPRDAQAHVLGVQGNLWTEHVRGDARAAQMAFPRASAVAELGWSAGGRRDFADFVRRLSPQMVRMKALGIAGSEAVFRPVATLSPDGAKARIALAGQPGLPIRYTLDGSAPSATSPVYEKPFAAAVPGRLRAASFLDGAGQPGAIDLPITAAALRHRDDTQLALCSQKVPLRLEDDYPATGKRAAFLIDIEAPCWTYEAAPMDGVTSIAIQVGQLPFNFQIGHDIDTIHFAPPATPDGEFEVRDGCDGQRVATLPLAPAAHNPGVTRLSAKLPPMSGAHDLCFTYTARGPNPLWAIAGVQLETAR